MVKKIRLDIDRDAVRARMESGEQMDSFAVWKASETGTYQWAYATLSRWHKAELIHIAKWIRRENGGMPRPVFAWGKKKDAPKPRPMSETEKASRYREKMRADPERWSAYCSKRSVRERTTPILDPIHAALLGYKRHGKAWIKKDEKLPHPDASAA